MDLYKGNKVAGIKEFEPQLANHDKPYVYATSDKIEAIIYSVKGGNLNYTNIYGYDDDGKRCLIERKENCLEEIYSVPGRFYVLDGSSFSRHIEIGVGDNEYVSELSVKVKEEVNVPNVWEFLKEQERLENIKVYRYPKRPSSYPKDDSDLIECAMLAYTQIGDLDASFNLLLKYHPELSERINLIKENIKNKTNDEIVDEMRFYK